MDEALALPSEKAVRLAVRTQQVIQHESGVANTVDPLGGSYFIEKLTNDMEAECNAIFERIEDMGGVIPALESGYFQKEIADASARFQREVESRDRIIVGVNEFQTEEDLEIPILKMDPEGERRHLARLKKVKSERDADAWGEAMRALETGSNDPHSNLMPLIIDAVNVGATSGEICNMWRRVFGEYKEFVVV
tara:strand:- start:5 stop:583 length:579 start_codon:yes stop_codon:yes gene_type:complete